MRTRLTTKRGKGKKNGLKWSVKYLFQSYETTGTSSSVADWQRIGTKSG